MIQQLINETAADCNGRGIWYPIWDKEIAWIIVICYASIVFIAFFRKAAHVQDKTSFQKAIFRGYGLFLLGYSLARILFIFSDIERWNNCETTLQIQFVLFSYTIGIFSALSLLSVMEKHVLHMEKMIGTKLYFGFASLSLILAIFASMIIEYIDQIRLFNTITNSIGAAMLMIIYMKVIMMSTGVIRKQAIMIFCGVLLVFLGSIIDGELIIRTLNIPIWLPAIFPMLGFTLILMTMRYMGVD